MIRIRLSGKFDLSYKRLISPEPQLKEIILTKIRIFRKKPLDSRLRNHPLKGKLKGKWAFSITDNIRIVYEWKSKNVVRLLAIGKHEDVYKTPLL